MAVIDPDKLESKTMFFNTGKIWLDIPSLRGYYQASNSGEIRRIPKGNIIKQECSDPYPRIDISINGIRKKVRVHTLVAEAFYGKKPKGMHIRHIDSNKSNSAPYNLIYGTPEENGRDSRINGDCRKEFTKLSKLKRCEVGLIKRLLKCGIKNILISKIFKISQQLVCDIKKHRAWAYVEVL